MGFLKLFVIQGVLKLHLKTLWEIENIDMNHIPIEKLDRKHHAGDRRDTKTHQ